MPPLDPGGGQFYIIANVGGSHNLLIRTDSGSLLNTLPPGNTCRLISSISQWYPSVDIAGGGLPEAPNDGLYYTRRNLGWVDADSNFATDAALSSGLATKQPLDADLTALSALTGTNTIYYRSAPDTWTAVVIGDGLSFTTGTLKGAIFTTTLLGAVPAPGSVTGKFLRDDGTWQAVAGGGLVVNTSPISGGASGSFLYDNAGVLGERTPTQATSVLSLFSTSTTAQGVVPGSNGAAATSFLNATGAWSVPAGGAGGGGGPLAVRVITSSTTYGPSGTVVMTPGTASVIIECVGGGGQGGGVVGSASAYFGGGGGGSGGYSRKLVTAAAIGSSQSVTVGAGGAGATPGANNGNAGTTTSVGSLCIANGGFGGGFSAATPGFGWPGAGASPAGAVGDVIAAGTTGIGGYFNNALGLAALCGCGASGPFGGGASFSFTNSTANAGVAGSNYGAGGSGASAAAATGSFAGGAGSAGVVIITEYGPTANVGLATTVNIQKFTASGTYTPSVGLVSAIIECIGSGAGGGGSAFTAGQNYGGGGGGSGSYSRSSKTAAQIGASQAITIGPAGNGGVAATGTAGGDVSFGSLVIGKGGSPGVLGSTAVGGVGGAGGVVGTGDLAFAGAPGGNGFYNGSNTLIVGGGGFGGSSAFGGGAPPNLTADTNGSAGLNYGSGGSGGVSSAANKNGGDGSAGIVIVTEFIAVSVPFVDVENFKNLSLAASVSTNILTVALKDAAGNDPTASSACKIAFRNASASNGSLTTNSVIAPLSISTAVGASLGAPANFAFRFWVLGFDIGGGNTVLGLYNAYASGGNTLGIDENALTSATAIGAGSTGAQTFYAASPVTNRPVKILGFVEYNSTGLATPGTYTRAPDFVQVFGPGVKAPGEIVQTLIGGSTSAFTTTSSTFQTTNASKAITPKSAANLLRLSAQGLLSNANSSLTDAIIHLHAAAAPLGMETRYSGGAALTSPAYSPAALHGYDRPNTISSITYSVKLRSSDNTTTVGFPPSVVNPWTMIQIEEIQS
jgi:hypothetical protein